MSFLIQYPPYKIIIVLMLIIMGVSIKHLDTLIFLLAYGQLLLALCRVPFSYLWRRLRFALPFIVFSLLFFSLYEDRFIVHVGFLDVSMYGVEKASIYATRLLFTLQLLTLLFYRMTIPEFFQALVRLRVPGIFIELILFTLRFTDVIREEAVRMFQALRSRGMKQRSFFSWSSYAVLSQLLGNLLLRSLARSERIYMGMMSRGYRGIPPQLELAPAAAADWALMPVWLIPVLIVFVYDIMGR
ncbi:cobalt ECF transporter T component CbiQ [Paenibacillus radicis (ex Xue et al. 2023)]|uniref:Cobalt ECF transporter T component CbiQ n=1 Tax=Paenibacillus radicis (ex Xue et al. 2023) TaxID=2972489 RepID=A0ABT1YC49_9BACL|nr:cobalt ECF transporter T component CbiQ [Paenibacillus radicis (ex Xue et al. 2023)]MCR8629788.1 cobalt ECF transporter T component CbiQ [Paenibacillus radicis (ex Xue et al. 2023)]